MTKTADRDNYKGTAGQLSLGATYGDQTKAYRWTVETPIFNIGIDLVAVLKGSEVMLFTYGDLGTPPGDASRADIPDDRGRRGRMASSSRCPTPLNLPAVRFPPRRRDGLAGQSRQQTTGPRATTPDRTEPLSLRGYDARRALYL